MTTLIDIELRTGRVYTYDDAGLGCQAGDRVIVPVASLGGGHDSFIPATVVSLEPKSSSYRGPWKQVSEILERADSSLDGGREE